MSSASLHPSAAFAVSQQDAMAFGSEEATMGSWRKSVADLQVLFEDKYLEDETGTVRSRNMPEPMLSTVSFHLPPPDTFEGDEDEEGGCCRGLRIWSPRTYEWITGRMSTTRKHLLVVAFMVLEGVKYLLAREAFVPGVNNLSILVVENLVSLMMALFVTLLLEGAPLFYEVLSGYHLVRFAIAALLFTLAQGLVLTAFCVGASPVEVVTFGYIHMPVSAVLSYFAFSRRYGRLEWLSVGMLTLGVLAFVLLREESAEGETLQLELHGFLLVMGSVFASVLGSIIAERIFKDRSGREGKQDRFYAIKLHLDLSALIIAAVLWSIPLHKAALFRDFMLKWERSEAWFGDWGIHQSVMVVVMVAHGWAAGLITREFSTVIRSILQTLALITVFLLGDPLRGNRDHFVSRSVPSWLLFVIVIMAALIFQTGRVNLKVIRKACNLGEEANPGFDLSSLAKSEADPYTPKAMRHARRRERNEERPLKNMSERTAVEEACCAPMDASAVAKLLMTQALMLVYIVSDAGRTLILQKALSTTVTNSTVMGLVCFVVGVVVASCITAYFDGLEGLRCAWQPEKILRCLPAAFLFALATTLGNLGFAMGISPALYLVLGKFYTPVAAFCARYIMGKFYMPLEWLALIILTLSSAAFGYLQAYPVGETAPPAPMAAMAVVLGSATVSALASLVTEKILKGDRDPFHMQKVRLDFGSVVSSVVLIPIIGLVATRPQDVPWAARPESYATCSAESVCWNLSAGTCGNPDCQCECTSGIFAGWDTWLLFLAVFVNTTQGWLVGKVTHTFSVVHRAIADSFSLLAIYFIGDPIFNGKSLENSCLNLVAMIVPLSTATFSVATSEMQRAFEAHKKLSSGVYTKSGRLRVTSADFESDDESVMLGSAVHNLSMSVTANTP